MLVNRTKYATLQEAVDDLKQLIDIAAGEARLRYITSVPGQEAVYLEKKRQAEDFIANSPTDMTGYEYVEMEAIETGVTNLAAANLIVTTANLWNGLLSPQIEAKRIGSKAQLSALDSQTDSVQDAVAIGYAAISFLNGI